MSEQWKLISSLEMNLPHKPNIRWLYDMVADPYEKTNLLASHPDIVEQLLAIQDGYDDEMMQPLWNSFIDGANNVNNMTHDNPDDTYIYLGN